MILGAVIDSYKDFLDETYRNVSDDTLKLIEKARDLLDRDLKDKRKKYRTFRENSPLVAEATPKDGVTPSQARLGELESKRLVLIVRAAEIEERLRAVENARKQEHGRAEVVQALSTAPALDRANASNPDQALRLALLPLLLEEQALLEDYAEDHPQVKAVHRKIQMTRDLYESASTEPKVSGAVDPVEAYVKTLKQEQVNVDVGRQALVRLAGEEQKKSKELRHYEDEDEEFRNEITQTHALWDQTIKRLQEINVDRDFGGYSVQMISSPGEGGKIGAPAMQTVVAGVFVGLLLGIGLAYMADRADKSFRSPEEIRRRLGLPVVAHLPVLSDEQAVANPDGAPLDGWLACYHRPASPEGEVYRSLRTAVFFSLRGEVHKVIQVTSANMGDGKSTIAANLAIVIAQSGKRVVLVDADLRRPRVHTLFGVRSPTGLSSVIAGDAELSAALRDSGVEHLSLLVCGPRPSNPAELPKLSHALSRFLGELRGAVRHIIADYAFSDGGHRSVRGRLPCGRRAADGAPGQERAASRRLSRRYIACRLSTPRCWASSSTGLEAFTGDTDTSTIATRKDTWVTTRPTPRRTPKRTARRASRPSSEANGTATAKAVVGTVRKRKKHSKKSAGWIARWFR